VLSDAGIKLHQYVATCSLGGLPCNISRDFVFFFHPYYFNCFTYHKPKSSSESADDSSDDNRPWLMPGLDSGLSVVVLTGSGMLDQNKGQVDVMLGLYDAGGATAGSDGVRVMIHPPDVVPFPLAEGFDVPPGFTASLSVRPRRNERIGPPHGDCIDHDPLLPAGGHQPVPVYRQIACQQRCLQLHVKDRCRCFDESLPVDDPDPSIPPCRSIDFPEQCAQVPDDIGPCVDALLAFYDRVKCAKQVKELILNRANY